MKTLQEINEAFADRIRNPFHLSALSGQDAEDIFVDPTKREVMRLLDNLRKDNLPPNLRCWIDSKSAIVWAGRLILHTTLQKNLNKYGLTTDAVPCVLIYKGYHKHKIDSIRISRQTPSQAGTPQQTVLNNPWIQDNSTVDHIQEKWVDSQKATYGPSTEEIFVNPTSKEIKDILAQIPKSQFASSQARGFFGKKDVVVWAGQEMLHDDIRGSLRKYGISGMAEPGYIDFSKDGRKINSIILSSMGFGGTIEHVEKALKKIANLSWTRPLITKNTVLDSDGVPDGFKPKRDNPKVYNGEPHILTGADIGIK